MRMSIIDKYLIIFFAVNLSIFAHIFPVKNTFTSFAFETPDMPLLIQSYQCLAVNDFVLACTTFLT